MPKLISVGPYGTTGINLDNLAFYRLQLGASNYGSDPALALVVRYPPAGDRIALAMVTVPVASEVTEIEQLAAVGLITNEEETDKSRLVEAYQMFKNKPRAPRDETIQQAAEAGTMLVAAYWQIRRWLTGDAGEDLSVEVDRYTVLSEP